MKSHILFLSLFLLSACQLPASGQLPTTPSAGESKNPPIVDISPTPTSVPPTTGTPVSNSLKFVIRQANNFDSNGLALLEKARSLLDLVVNSEEFKNQILNFTYQGQATFVQNDGLTNEQIYNRIMAGAEQYPKATGGDNNADLYLELYTSSWFGRNTIGYTSPSISTVYMNTYYFDYADASEVADNMMHEWLHKLGFDHDSNATARRPYSVPYAVGYIVEALVKKLQ